MTTRTPSVVRALQKILTLPHFKNDAASSGAVHGFARHEEALSHVFSEEGFAQFIPSNKLQKSQAEQWLSSPELSTEIPDNSFIPQPFGTHQAPDFILKVNEKCVFFIEAKSSETSLAPTYNSGGVKPEYLYVFCAKKTNQTTIFKGDSIITAEQQEKIDELIKIQRFVEKRYNELIKDIDTNHRGISYYTRPMIIQSGGGEFTNYFTHENREADEKRAIEWVAEKTGEKIEQEKTE